MNKGYIRSVFLNFVIKLTFEPAQLKSWLGGLWVGSCGTKMRNVVIGGSTSGWDNAHSIILLFIVIGIIAIYMIVNIILLRFIFSFAMCTE